jgi:phage terminase small subunit
LQMPQIDPPSHLSDRARALWQSVVPSRGSSPERLAAIQTALEALDRADLARLEIERSGMTSVTPRSGAVHMHPLLRVEREARQQFLGAWQRLGLASDPPVHMSMEQTLRMMAGLPPDDEADSDLEGDDE